MRGLCLTVTVIMLCWLDACVPSVFACGCGWYTGDGGCNPSGPGYFSFAGWVWPQPLDPGYHGSTECIPNPNACEAGYMCPSPDRVSNPTSKPPGGTGTPIRCPAGSFCPPQTGYPSLCSAGYKCPEGGVAQIQCDSGTFSLAGASSCTPCSPGFWCGKGSTTAMQYPCDPGFYCGVGSNSSQGIICPAGFMCPEGSAAPQECAAGYFSNEGQSTCSPCDAGYTCAPRSTSAQQTACLNGTFSPVGAASCLPCSEGFWCGVASPSATQFVCPAGVYCVGNTSSSSGDGLCNPGHFCPPGSSSASGSGLCYAGYVCPLGSSSPISAMCGLGNVCPPGSSVPQKLSQGEYSMGGSPDGLTRTQSLPCQAGNSCDGMGEQVPCPMGTAQPESNSSTCLPCGPGTVAEVTGLSKCSPCLFGQQPVGSPAQCQACQPGSESPHGVSCQPCPLGTSSSSNNTVSCLPCARGTYSDHEGQSVCQFCPVGRFASGLGSQGCKLCAPGSYASQNQTTYCSPCIPGTSSNFTGLTEQCPQCQSGEAQSIEGQESCIFCLPPYYSPIPGSSICTLCSYVVTQNRTKCEANPCPSNYEYINTPDGINSGCQLCPLGKYSNNATIGGCVNCLSGYYTPRRGSACTSCSQSSDQDGLICVDGFASVKPDYFAYLTDPDPVTGLQLYATESCPIGFCPGGQLQFNAESDTILSNITGSSTNMTSIIYCQFPRLNSADNLLCGECVEGYLPWASKCVSCTEVNSALFFGGFILSISLVIFLLRSGGSAAGPLAILLYFSQTAALEIGSVSQWLNWLHVVNFGTESTSACLAPWSPIQQMIFSIFIPVILVGEILALALGHRVLKLFYSHTDSSSPHFRWLRNLSLDASIDRYVGGVMSVLLFTYTQVTVTCFKYLYCIDVGSHHRLVFTAPTIDCHSSEYRSGLGLVGFTIAIYVIGFPLAILIFLYQFRHQHSNAPTSVSSAPVLPSTLSTFSPSSLSDYSLDSGRMSDQSSPLSDNEPPTTPINQLTPFALRYGPLYLMFQSHAWFYQPFILLRRASFVLISVLLVQEPASRFLGFGLGNFASLLIHLYLHPFSRPGLNQLETGSYILLIIVSMVLAAYLPPYSLPIQIFVFLCILPFATGMIIIVLKQQLTQLHQLLSKRSKEMNQTNEISRSLASDPSTDESLPSASVTTYESPHCQTDGSISPNPAHHLPPPKPVSTLSSTSTPQLPESQLNDVELTTIQTTSN